MASRYRRGELLRDVSTLFDTGTTTGLSDGELLGQVTERSAQDEGAELAFAALVDRHAPMVLRVCRSILRDDHDALDAFQATFLVLVRRADAVRRRESAASWLHGVALRVAAHARAGMARRRRHERRAGELALTVNRSGANGVSPELTAILHEELSRLPERYRAPLVLCHLEGHTCESAASRLGWPVGTVKSRLSRGRERLRGRLTRRGLAPDEMSADVVIPAALTQTTVRAMLHFAAGRPIAGAVSESALYLTLRSLNSMRMTRLATISALLISGLAAAGAAMLITQKQRTAQAQSPALTKTERFHSVPAAQDSQKKSPEVRSVRVIDGRGKGVPDVEIKVVERDPTHADGGAGYRTSAYRTDADGRFRMAVDSRYRTLTIEAHGDDQAIGWASLHGGRLITETKAANPVILTLLPRNHQVEGTIVDTREKPIRGVLVRAVQFDHDANGFALDYPDGVTEPSLGSAVTDEAGRYRLSIPQDTIVLFTASHAWVVGPMFSARPDDRTLSPVTLEDGGGVAGVAIDAATGQPVVGARIVAQCLEFSDRILGGGSGRATTDAQGHFAVGGLAPGVYNLLFNSSPKGRKITARAVEGVRVKAGELARADLALIEGRRLHGTVVDASTGEPLAGVNILCYNASHPRSGAACQGNFTDERGIFEFFVPPGPAFVYINASGNGLTLNVPADRDPDPVVLKQGHDPNAKPASPVIPFECEVRVRVKTNTGDHLEPIDDRSLSGRVFDKHGSPVVGVRLTYNENKTTRIVATDRLGLFRLKGLPVGQLLLGVTVQNDQHGFGHVPAGAVEIDVIFPQ